MSRTVRVKTLSPVVLAGSVVLPSAPGGAVGLGVAGVQLQNSAKTPILIDEVRFRIQLYTGLSVAVPVTQDYGSADSRAGSAGVIGVKLSLGRLQLTADKFIPLGLLCQPLDPAVEAANGINGYIGWARGSNAFTWKLPKPLYLPGSETIIPSFKIVGDFAPALIGPFKIDIAFVGRALSSDTPKPTSVPVPFATHWRDVLRQGAADYRGVKSDRELQNPYAESLMVQRISGGLLCSLARGGLPGRVPAFPLFAGYTLFGSGNGNPNAIGTGAGSPDQVANELVTARIVKSDGQPVVRDAVPWGYLFPPNTRSFDVLAILKQGEFYQVQADALLSSVFSADVTVQIMAAIIGYRKIAYDPTVEGYGYMEAA